MPKKNAISRSDPEIPRLVTEGGVWRYQEPVVGDPTAGETPGEIRHGNAWTDEMRVRDADGAVWGLSLNR